MTVVEPDLTDNAAAAQSAAELEAARTRAARAERELAMARAGVPIDSDLGAMFVRGYPADASIERDAILAEWQKVAPPAAPAADATTEPPAAEVTPAPAPGTTEFEQRQALASEGHVDTAGEDPIDAAVRLHADSGKSDLQRVGAAFNDVMAAAQKGDRRVLAVDRHPRRYAGYIDPA